MNDMSISDCSITLFWQEVKQSNRLCDVTLSETDLQTFTKEQVYKNFTTITSSEATNVAFWRKSKWDDKARTKNSRVPVIRINLQQINA